ncbi:hypothetical protein N7478_003500 [Penicillium angulare]|uniref:uncharacterized protein n=1 Tax=Penicillium angulare TaxID=116970 RepID=UPI002541CB16|nr:uncharacterized protein N7478_003500 [Penicillium angulare]KAJ5287814.1 hypothetical protein N7478_003500 [Penicillium angulare]
MGLAVADGTSVVSLFIYGADQQSLVASVVETKTDEATYSINCPSGTKSSDCGFEPGLLYTEGPTTVQWHLQTPYDADKFGHVICSTGGTTTAVCTEVTPTNGSAAQASETTTLSSDQISLLAVTITAGPNGTGINSTASATESSVAATAGANPSAGSASSSGNTPPMSMSLEILFGGLAVGLIAIAL